MSERGKHAVQELVALARDSILDIRQHLNYYRASVYKAEASHTIRTKIESLRKLIDLMPFQDLDEPLLDYDSERFSSTQFIPGESLFTMQVSRLLLALDQQLEDILDKLKLQEPEQVDYDGTVLTNRDFILSLCRQGSPQWKYFQKF